MVHTPILNPERGTGKVWTFADTKDEADGNELAEALAYSRARRDEGPQYHGGRLRVRSGRTSRLRDDHQRGVTTHEQDGRATARQDHVRWRLGKDICNVCTVSV